MLTKRLKGSRVWSLAAAMMVIGAFAFVACGDDDDDGDDNGGAETPAATQPAGDGGFDYGSLGGEIRVDGSSTVFPISEAVAEEFSAVADTRVNVAFSGTGGGFEKFCRGEIEIADASRPINDEETQACADAEIADVVELRIATDALTVVVNPANDFVECLTIQQLHDIFTGTANNWNQVDPAFPDATIVRFFPGTDSGTFDYFVEEIIEGVDEAAVHTGDGTPSEDDNVLALGVEGDDNAIGYFGFAYYQGAGSNLKAVSIDNGEGCVAPSEETALDGTYAPLSRPLFIYTSEALLQERIEVLGFVNFYLENAATLATEVKYIAVPEDVAAQQVAKIEPFLP